MLKISKRIFIILAFILAIGIYELIQEALQFKEANENKARENLSALIKWSENEGKEELEYAKNLSKENYNQEKVTQMIIKNLKMIQASIEDIRILTSYYPTDEDVELMRQAGHVTTNSNTDIILYLLYNERNITNHKTYFLFDKERFKVFEDFLFFLNTRLEEDFLQKNIHKFDSFDVVRIGTYVSDLIGYNSGFTSMYLSEFLQDYICDLNTPKTITILNGMSQINIATDKVLLFLNKELKIHTDSHLKMQLEKAIYNFKKLKLGQKQTNKLKSIQSKLKECTNE
ncbi:hypothetical protein CSUB8523_1143 [Campylobacter subantarcticus LMG 24377]|uniref:Uncharacterized protein n=2 Tax=Campylobacter subantarcticus TaxID=497724 RepID=A0A0A8H9R7_9BACT|nr:hypothetical protein [Campylobacter subantarcticus]EAL3939801.1 hypothetical protein [Campylobacter lari]AJC90873.1 hypothetical protein CSUB8521_1037 [Campylobacter subantarcticus LMG 24374]AJC92648.1 hypothetical protein CSUB8523_1140 [Campylobacter subantarcticus LMG 24377]AJC92651.1 hypothetical protein CSUB8523_1143 [Campylobacter subantarcticus LMG 24377]MPB99266.1 hypothetical protein [Campylobacter subantarcticus]